jgi:hypothetical protein
MECSAPRGIEIDVAALPGSHRAIVECPVSLVKLQE